MLEYPDEAERRERLRQLTGIEELISIQIAGFDPIFPIANEDLPRSTQDKSSAVHFMRCEFTDEMIAAAKKRCLLEHSIRTSKLSTLHRSCGAGNRRVSAEGFRLTSSPNVSKGPSANNR